MKTKYVFTIVTVCYNAESEIEETIKSVLSQSYTDFEYIIVDGKSSDGTLSIIQEYENQGIKYISETDRGIYDAMNKGIRLSHGQYILFMNAGDYFSDENVLIDLYKFVASNKNREADVIYGNAIYLASNRSKIGIALPIGSLKYTMIASHQSTFIKTDILHKYLFDLQYRYAADYNQISQLYLDGYRFYHIDRIIAKVAVEKGTTYNYFVQSKREVLKILLKRRVPNAYFYFYKEIIRFKIVRFIKRISKI